MPVSEGRIDKFLAFKAMGPYSGLSEIGGRQPAAQPAVGQTLGGHTGRGQGLADQAGIGRFLRRRAIGRLQHVAIAEHAVTGDVADRTPAQAQRLKNGHLPRTVD